MRSQPTILRVLQNSRVDRAKLGHQRFNLAADQDLCQIVDSAAYQIVPATQGKGQADAGQLANCFKLCHGVRILRIGMYAVGAGAFFQREAQIVRLNGTDDYRHRFLL